MNNQHKIERVAMAIEESAATLNIDEMNARRDHAARRLGAANRGSGALAHAWCAVMNAWECRALAVKARIAGDIQAAMTWERYSEARLRSARVGGVK